MLAKTYPRVIDKVGELNPQLFREIKGRLQIKNVALVSAFSIIGQFLIYLYFKARLPIVGDYYSRYCTVTDDYSRRGQCTLDLLGNILTIKELWWFDIFTTMSIIGIFILLVIGSYLLIADIAKEESTGSLNFIRLSPQSAWSIWGGKILGVPILVYLFGALAIPFHLVAGLSANIPLISILGFYLVLAVSCFFFYSLSLLFASVRSNLGHFQALLGAGMIFFFLLIIMGITLNSYSSQYTETTFDWLILFYPGVYLTYLAKSTFLPPNTIDYLNPEALMNLNWYGKFFWRNSVTALGFILVNYGIWSFWIWQGLKRRFHNPSATVISKYHSYWLSGCFIVFNLGFALQDFSPSYHSVEDNLIVVQLFNFILFLILIAALSPQRQTLQDWARYRHENTKAKRNLWRDLLLGEKSPAVLAIAFNIGIVTLYLIPTILLFPFSESKSLIIMGFVLGGAIVLLYATVVQLLFMLKNDKRALIAFGTVGILMVAPFLSALILPHIANDLAVIGLFTAFPIIVINEVSLMGLIGSTLGYIATLSVLNWQMKRVLNKAGMSETKMLLASKN